MINRNISVQLLSQQAKLINTFFIKPSLLLLGTGVVLNELLLVRRPQVFGRFLVLFYKILYSELKSRIKNCNLMSPPL